MEFRPRERGAMACLLQKQCVFQFRGETASLRWSGPLSKWEDRRDRKSILGMGCSFEGGNVVLPCRDRCKRDSFLLVRACTGLTYNGETSREPGSWGITEYE